MRHSVEELRSCAAGHLEGYLDPQGMRAFHVYDRLGDPDELTPLDCLAPVLLSAGMRDKDVVPMFAPVGPATRLREAMEELLHDENCRSANFLQVELDDPHGPWERIRAVLRATKDVPRIKASKVTKILHRKRPSLVPVYDREVFRFFVGKSPSGWKAPDLFWPLLQEDLLAHGDWVAELAEPLRTPDGRPLTLLRAADIIVWEHQVTRCGVST